MPVVMLFLFGYGVSFDLERIPIAIVDRDRTEASRALVHALTASRELVLGGARPSRRRTPIALFRRGAAVAVLVVPARLRRGRARAASASAVQLLVDGADADSSRTRCSRRRTRSSAQRRGGCSGRTSPRREPPLQVKVWTRYNPAGRSALFMVPGLAAYLLAISAVLLTALTVAGEWERGSMEQLFASPVGRLEIVARQAPPVPRARLLELLLVVAFGAAAFDLPLRGSPGRSLLLGLFFLVGMLGQGLLISVSRRTRLVATQAGALSSLLPSLLLSGMIFPIENMPLAAPGLSRVIPARYLVHALRGVLLKGNGLAELWPDLLALVVFAGLVLALATARFQRRLA